MKILMTERHARAFAYMWDALSDILESVEGEKGLISGIQRERALTAVAAAARACDAGDPILDLRKFPEEEES